MYDYKKDLERLKKPENIREALAASSPYVLMRAFENDMIVRRLIDVGKDVVPLISKEFKTSGFELPEITLACYAYILQKVDPKSAKEVLKPLFKQIVDKPSPFFVHFAAYTLRQSVNLPVSPLQKTFSKTELAETLKALEPKKPKSKKTRRK